MLTNLASKVGVDVSELKDNLRSTLYEAILKKSGYDTSALPDRLESTYLEALVSCGLGGGSGGSSGVVSTIESASPTNADIVKFSKLGPVKFPNAESISASAFYDCTSLTSIDLPAATSIGASAFLNCTALTSIDLPAATSIGASAFYRCTNFATLILRTTETVCQIDVSALLGTKIMTEEGAPTGEGFIYLPARMDSAYRAVYEPIFEELGAPGMYDILFRRLEDYTVDGTATGKLDESKI